jgi:sulfite exporter TauE/SafE
MSISADERRFLRQWEEQRQGGRSRFVLNYTIGFLVSYFMIGVAIGLFGSIPFIRPLWISLLFIVSLVAAFVTAVVVWHRGEHRFSSIINRESSGVH